jgi:hypothetical protein
MDYTSAQLGRLTHADAAHELSERLVSIASTHVDGYGRGAFLTEEANQVLADARALLAAAVVADRVRGASWAEVGEALGISKQSAHERFGDAEREFRDALLFPHRDGPPGGLGYTVAPYAVEQPDTVRERLDRWVVEHRRSSGPGCDEPQPVTRGLEVMSDRWTTDAIGQVTQLARRLIDRTLPDGVSEDTARRRLAEVKLELYERMHVERPDDPEVAVQLMEARDRIAQLDAADQAAR